MLEDVLRDLKHRVGKDSLHIEPPKKNNNDSITSKNEAKESLCGILASMAAYAITHDVPLEPKDKDLQKIYERYKKMLKGRGPTNIRELADAFKRIQHKILSDYNKKTLSRLQAMINELSRFADMDLYNFQAGETKGNLEKVAKAIKDYVGADLLSWGTENTFGISMTILDDDLVKVLSVNPNAPKENIYNRIFWEHERHHLTYSSPVRDEIYAVQQEIRKVDKILEAAKTGDKKAQYLTAHALYALNTLMKSFKRLKEMDKMKINNVKEVKYHITHAVLPTMFDHVPSRSELLATLPIIKEMLIKKYPNLKKAIQQAIDEIKHYA